MRLRSHIPVFGTAPLQKRRRRQPEKALQSRVCEFLCLALPPDATYLVLPGGAATKTKAPGYVCGTPDLLIVWRGRAFFIELKAGKGKASDEQEALIAKLRVCGAAVAILNSLDQVENQLLLWGIHPLRARLVGAGGIVRQDAA